jgi:hypothetical protein
MHYSNKVHSNYRYSAPIVALYGGFAVAQALEIKGLKNPSMHYFTYLD